MDGHRLDLPMQVGFIQTTRSPPEWRSGRSMTADIVFDLRSLIWSFGESCTIVRGINSEPENVLSNVLQFLKAYFSTPDLGLWGDVVVGDKSI